MENIYYIGSWYDIDSKTAEIYMTLFNILDSANIQWIWEIRKKTQENLRIEQHNDMHDELLAQQRCNYAIVGILNVRNGSCVNQSVFM